MIWKNNPTIEALNDLMKNTLVEFLGIKIEEIGEDYIKSTMEVTQNHKQPMGLLHGGASCVVSESMGSIAGVLILDDPLKEQIVGVDINATHLKAVRSGIITSYTKPIKIGRKIQVWETKIYDENGNLTCISKLTTMKIS